jgi:hypothetical protein
MSRNKGGEWVVLFIFLFVIVYYIWEFLKKYPLVMDVIVVSLTLGAIGYILWKSGNIGDTTKRAGEGREPIPSHVRKEVWNRDGGRCVRCGSREMLEFDHIVPISKGGSNTARNIELLCQNCNRSKSAKIE